MRATARLDFVCGENCSFSSSSSFCSAASGCVQCACCVMAATAAAASDDDRTKTLWNINVFISRASRACPRVR